MTDEYCAGVKDSLTTEEPKRVQATQEAAEQLPNTVYVGNGSKWANPGVVGMVDWYNGNVINNDYDLLRYFGEFVAMDYASSKMSVKMGVPRPNRYPQTIIRDLRGKNLACLCELDQPCHADSLLAIANSPHQTKD